MSNIFEELLKPNKINGIEISEITKVVDEKIIYGILGILVKENTHEMRFTTYCEIDGQSDHKSLREIPSSCPICNKSWTPEQFAKTTVFLERV